MSDETGVKQGGPNSPDMFVDFLSDLRDYLNEKCGIVVDNDILLHLLWADDLIIVANSTADLQNSIDLLYKYCSRWQLILNVLKTKIMLFGKDPTNVGHIFKFNGNDIDVTTECKYLGCVFQNKFASLKEHINIVLKGLAHAKIIKKSVILFRVLNMTI